MAKRKSRQKIKTEVKPIQKWDSSELDFRLAVSQALRFYESALLSSQEKYRRQQLALHEEYRKVEIGIVNELRDLGDMLATIDAIKDSGQHKILYDTENGIGYRLVPRECGFNSQSKGIEEKIVNKPS